MFDECVLLYRRRQAINYTELLVHFTVHVGKQQFVYVSMSAVYPLHHCSVSTLYYVQITVHVAKPKLQALVYDILPALDREGAGK